MKALKKLFFIGGGSKEIKPLDSAKKILGINQQISALVVDDDADYGAMVVQYLTAEKIKAALAINGISAMRLIEGQKFDCILLDYNLDDDNLDEVNRNGDWVIRQMRENPESLNYDTPIIIISGYIDHEHEVMQEKVQGMLEKPVSNAILSSMIKQIVQKK